MQGRERQALKPELMSNQKTKPTKRHCSVQEAIMHQVHQLLQILVAQVQAAEERKTKTATEIAIEIRVGNMTATEVLGGCNKATFEYFLA